MKKVDIVDLTKKAVAQTMGKEYMEQNGNLADLEGYKLVDVGRDVVDSGSTETFTKSLLSLIGKMYIDAREYVQDLPSIFVDTVDWGWFVERIKFELADIIQDPMWNLVSGEDYSKIEHTFYQPKVKAKVFEEGKAILTPQSFGEDQLKEAFLSFEALDRFYSGIRQYVKMTVDSALFSYAHMLVSMGVVVSAKATHTAVHLLTEAKAKGIASNELTAEQALEDENCMKYFMRRIANVRGYMERLSVGFNNGSIATFTPRAMNKCVLLKDFATASKFNVRANTFNEELLGIGEYDEIAGWQAVDDGTNKFDFGTLSSIKMSADPTNKLGAGVDAIELTNVIGLVYDRFALGLCPYKTKVTVSKTASGDFYTEFHHTLVNYILDADYNMVAFVLD